MQELENLHDAAITNDLVLVGMDPSIYMVIAGTVQASDVSLT